MEDSKLAFSSNGSGVTLTCPNIGQLKYSTEEFSYYESLFKILDTKNDGVLSTTNSSLLILLQRTDIPWKAIMIGIQIILEAYPYSSPLSTPPLLSPPYQRSRSNTSNTLNKNGSTSSSSSSSTAVAGVAGGVTMVNGVHTKGTRSYSLDSTAAASSTAAVAVSATPTLNILRFHHWLILCKLLAIYKHKQRSLSSSSSSSSAASGSSLMSSPGRQGGGRSQSNSFNDDNNNNNRNNQANNIEATMRACFKSLQQDNNNNNNNNHHNNNHHNNHNASIELKFRLSKILPLSRYTTTSSFSTSSSTSSDDAPLLLMKVYTPHLQGWKVYGEDYQHAHVKYHLYTTAHLLNNNNHNNNNHLTQTYIQNTTEVEKKEVEEEEEKYTVERRYSEFELFASILAKYLPGYILPPLPSKDPYYYYSYFTLPLTLPILTTSTTTTSSSSSSAVNTAATAHASSVSSVGGAGSHSNNNNHITNNNHNIHHNNSTSSNSSNSSSSNSSHSSRLEQQAQRRSIEFQLFLRYLCHHPSLRSSFALQVFLEASSNGLRAFFDLYAHMNSEGQLAYHHPAHGSSNSSSISGQGGGKGQSGQFNKAKHVSSNGPSSSHNGSSSLISRSGSNDSVDTTTHNHNNNNNQNHNNDNNNSMATWWGNMSKHVVTVASPYVTSAVSYGTSVAVAAVNNVVVAVGGVAASAAGLPPSAHSNNGSDNSNQTDPYHLEQKLVYFQQVEKCGKSLENLITVEYARNEEGMKFNESLKTLSDLMLTPDLAKVLQMIHRAGYAIYTQERSQHLDKLFYQVAIPCHYLGRFQESYSLVLTQRRAVIEARQAADRQEQEAKKTIAGLLTTSTSSAFTASSGGGSFSSSLTASSASSSTAASSTAGSLQTIMQPTIHIPTPSHGTDDDDEANLTMEVKEKLMQARKYHTDCEKQVEKKKYEEIKLNKQIHADFVRVHQEHQQALLNNLVTFAQERIEQEERACQSWKQLQESLFLSLHSL